MILTTKIELVIFSPARRASRKLLERIIEFTRLLGHEPCEYNQEQARVHTYDGQKALVRSFPSKVGVGAALIYPACAHVKGGAREWPSHTTHA